MSDRENDPRPVVVDVAVRTDHSHGIDPADQFRVVFYVALAIAGPMIIVHFLIGTLAFPYFSQLFGTMSRAMPWPSAVLLSIGWLAGPLLVIIDAATFWLLYRFAQRWWIGLLFVPVLIYMMMSAFIGFLLYIPLFPLITLVK
jgi:hypothetical protein